MCEVFYARLDMVALAGYLVLLPDYFRGQSAPANPADRMTFLKNVSQWSRIKADWQEKLKPYAEKHGATSFGTIGASIKFFGKCGLENKI